MSKLARILVTLGALLGFIFLFAFLVHSRKQGGFKTPGIMGTILLLGLIAGLGNIWKSPKDDSDDDDDMKLDKT